MSKNPDNPIQSVSNLLNGAAGGVTEWERKQHRRLVAEKLRRECEALRLYEPLEFQDEFHKCKSPKTYHGVAPGKHTFKVKAIDADGKLDPTPAKDKFRILP